MSIRTLPRAAGCLLVLGLLVGACGSDDGSTPSASDTATSSAPAGETAQEGAPDCDEVWVEGGKIPGGYRGCEDDGEFVPREGVPCSSGQWLAYFGDRFYGVLGGTVRAAESSLEDDIGYRDAVASCRA